MGAAYQELWKIRYANMYFDIFMDNLILTKNTINSFEKNGVDDVWVMKILILIRELQNIGLSYKQVSK